ncbi:phenylacetate--CoA ligase family protein [Tamlana fucoidanivorans]|uniref:phenylacetate--CoA ligase family protein n=1 Tax=Allotamlana fucoidanivorans TaxID=2583814 RepID=UPI0013052595|nr:phenylacetate--CoA ligase family protein [Tamlana fucoidanivorans]
MNLFYISLQINGFPIRRAIQKLKDIQSKKGKDYELYLNQKKNEIVQFHLQNNPFYAQFAKNANLKDWESIPIMTKQDLQQPLKNRLSKGFSLHNVHQHKTSGSSGHPFSFAKDKFCHALTWANFIDRYHWFDIDFQHSKQARFYGIPLHKKGYYKERLKDVLSHRYRFSVFDLSDSQMKKNIDTFKSTTFHYINGYTSAIVQLAKYLKQENIILKSVCPSLKACIVTSEMLFMDDRTLLETQLGVPVINEYGAAELGLIAFQNDSNEWIVNHEDLFIEILDENDHALPNGQTGRVVITSIYNKAHPFIRYDLGDVGSLSTKSTPEKPILENLIGRTDDLIKLPSGKTAAGLTFYYITKAIIDDDANVKEFTIEQILIDTFNIYYVSSKDLSDVYREKIKQAVAQYMEPNLTIHFERKTQLNRSHRGKLRQFKSLL